jgi:redox-sensitive bicupin YhaK (pirin superfamily)
MGPEVLRDGEGLDVAPHPHIGIATVTYLFEGSLTHRDSLGTVQRIDPGDVNWMIAGEGIAHSERTPSDERDSDAPLFGLQSWIALPKREEERAPSFAHIDATALPRKREDGVELRLLAGELADMLSPAPTLSPLFYADASMEAGSRLVFPDEYEERALYVTSGEVTIAGVLPARVGELVVFQPRSRPVITCSGVSGARLMLLGGDPFPERRFIWWNFVSTSQSRIEKARADWEAQRFAPVPDESEFIPAPRTTKPVPVRYP